MRTPSYLATSVSRDAHQPTCPAEEFAPFAFEEKEQQVEVETATALAGHRILLAFASNPFDHWDLFEAGYREWDQGSDALISGRRVPSMLDLFLAGFRGGTLGLLLVGIESQGDAISGAGKALNTKIPVGRQLPLKHLPGLDYDNRKGEAEHGSLLSRASIGFDTLSVKDGWLCGHLLYLKPEYRGRGLCRAYFEAVHALAGRLRLKGFQFISTLPRWKKGNFFDVELYTVQENGVEVFRYWKEA